MAVHKWCLSTKYTVIYLEESQYSIVTYMPEFILNISSFVFIVYFDLTLSVTTKRKNKKINKSKELHHIT